jgi:hypothetical protein
MSETFVDSPSTPMATPDTWPSLSYNQMLETKSQLMSKIWLARGKPMYLTPLNAALARLDALIEAKLNDPRGLS